MPSQPILAIERDQASQEKKAIPNLLPCRIHHTGPVDPVAPFWSPEHAPGSTSVAYFRGRKLQGETMALPDQFEGAVAVVKRQQQDSRPPGSQERDEGADEAVDVAALQVTARFDSVTVWSHDVAVDSASDPFIRHIGEWFHVADQVHSFAEQDESK